MSRGEKKEIGDTRGTALGREAFAGPVANVLYISNDLFSDDGFVFGNVFIDTNGNGKRDPGEAGIPGVGVFVESGEYALTDSTGRYSLPYLFSGYRIVRVDESTLPPEVQPVPPRTGESSFSWTERIVHLIPTGHAQVSFPLQAVPTVAEPVTRRVTCQERVAVQQSFEGLYQIPAIESSHFAVGEAYLKTESLGSLDPIWEFLARNPGWMVFLEGHTDSVPIHNSKFASNEELSTARASAVMRYLNAKGVADTRIIVRGYGDKQPIASNSTREGRARNRRVEV
ncbi:MAG: OmpA family protein, partial [bacterium]